MVAIRANTMVAIISTFGKPLTAEPSGILAFNRPHLGDWERWELEPHADGSVSLKSFHGKYLCSEPDGKFTADRESAGDWEKFYVEEATGAGAEDGKILFKSVHGLYLCANGEKVESRKQPGQWEQFQVVNVETSEDPAEL